MTMDERHRKLYVGDSRGNVRVFNINKGALIGTMEFNEEARALMGDDLTLPNREVCALKYLFERTD